MAKQKFDKVAVRAAKSTPENLRSAEQIALLAKFAAAKAASKARKMAARQQKLSMWETIFNTLQAVDPALRAQAASMLKLDDKAALDLTPLREQSEQTFEASFILGLVAKRIAALHNRGIDKEDKMSSKYFDVTIVDKDGNPVDGLQFKVVKAEDLDEDEDEDEDEESEDED